MRSVFVFSLRGLWAVSIVWMAFCWRASAQKDFLFEETLPSPAATLRNQVEAGMLYSGAEPRDLDEGVFDWDYVTYTSYRFRFDKQNQLRSRHQFWQSLDSNYRNVFDVGWWRRLDAKRAIAFSADFLHEKSGYKFGTVYAGYQGTMGQDWLYYVQGGIGAHSEPDLHGDVYFELLKPVTSSTLLRLRNEYYVSSSGYFSDTPRINLIQALSQRFAVNLGYRLFANNETADDVDDMISHEGSAALVYQARENLFMIGRYRYYWNTADREVNSYSVEARWNPTLRLSLVAGYQLQHYLSGPINNGFRVGASISF